MYKLKMTFIIGIINETVQTEPSDFDKLSLKSLPLTAPAGNLNVFIVLGRAKLIRLNAHDSLLFWRKELRRLRNRGREAC